MRLNTFKISRGKMPRFALVLKQDMLGSMKSPSFLHQVLYSLSAALIWLSGCAHSLPNATHTTTDYKLQNVRTFAIIPRETLPKHGLPLPGNLAFLADTRITHALEHEFRLRGYIQTLEPLADISVNYGRANTPEQPTFSLSVQDRQSGRIVYSATIAISPEVMADDNELAKNAGQIIWETLRPFPERSYAKDNN